MNDCLDLVDPNTRVWYESDMLVEFPHIEGDIATQLVIENPRMDGSGFSRQELALEIVTTYREYLGEDCNYVLRSLDYDRHADLWCVNIDAI